MQNPFGEAKPREAILAAKTGRSEQDIVREEASKTKVHVREGCWVRRKGCLAEHVGALVLLSLQAIMACIPHCATGALYA